MAPQLEDISHYEACSAPGPCRLDPGDLEEICALAPFEIIKLENIDNTGISTCGCPNRDITVEQCSDAVCSNFGPQTLDTTLPEFPTATVSWVLVVGKKQPVKFRPPGACLNAGQREFQRRRRLRGGRGPNEVVPYGPRRWSGRLGQLRGPRVGRSEAGRFRAAGAGPIDEAGACGGSAPADPRAPPPTGSASVADVRIRTLASTMSAGRDPST